MAAKVSASKYQNCLTVIRLNLDKYEASHMQSSILCIVLYNTWTFTLKFQGFQNPTINFLSFQGFEIIRPLFQNFQEFQNRVRTLITNYNMDYIHFNMFLGAPIVCD